MSQLDNAHPHLFFGNVHARVSTNADVTVHAELLELKINEGVPMFLSKRYESSVPTDAPGPGIAVTMKNALISKIHSPTSLGDHKTVEVEVFYYGLLIQLTKRVNVRPWNDAVRHQLPYSVCAPSTAAALSIGNFNASNVFNFWDASSAATGIPNHLGPVKKAHLSGTLTPVFTGRGAGLVESAAFIAAPAQENEEYRLMIPRNFLGFLQHLYAATEGAGSQFVVPETPTIVGPAYSPLAQMITELILANRQKLVEFGTNPTRFRLMAYDYSQPDITRPMMGGNVPISLSTLFFGVDPLEKQGVAITRTASVVKFVGAATKVVSLFYPHCPDPENTCASSVAYDLLQVDIKEILISLPPPYVGTRVNYEGDTEFVTALSFSPTLGLRSRSQYASNFKYPAPLT